MAADDDQTKVDAEPGTFYPDSDATIMDAHDSDATILATYDADATILGTNTERQLDADRGIARPEGKRLNTATSGKPHSNVDVDLRGQSNVILAASNTLISFLGALGNIISRPNIPQLQQQLATEISNLDAYFKRSSVRNEVALSARYILCSALDEAILNTSWGVDSDWEERSLLHTYHYEKSGGDRFFSMLDQLTTTSQKNPDLLELFYILLCLGFKGKYQADPAGNAHLDAVRERLYQELYGDRLHARALSDPTHLTNIARPSLRQQIPLWVVLSVALAFTLQVYTGLHALMYSRTMDVTRSFDDIYPEEQSK